MKNKAILAVSIALAFFAALTLGSARLQAQDAQSATTPGNNNVDPAAQAAAAQMVPAQAFLDAAIDARKMQPGQQIKATLSDTVHLKNGTELPKGTALVGTIANDSAQRGSRATLALRFTQAEVKGGQAIPIEATIVGVAPPFDESASDYSRVEPAPAWDGTAIQVDDEDVLSGLDMHSKIDGNNSAVFVSTRKDDVKLPERTQLSLAIGAEGAGETNAGSL